MSEIPKRPLGQTVTRYDGEPEVEGPDIFAENRYLRAVAARAVEALNEVRSRYLDALAKSVPATGEMMVNWAGIAQVALTDIDASGWKP